MREIKFRAWHTDLKKMEYPEKELKDDVDYWDGIKSSVLSMINSQLKRPDMVFMQFTELKGRDGTEIFDGDIIRTYLRERTGYDYVGIVSFRFGQWTADYKGAFPFVNSLYSWATKSEVIGNIYETPELIL